MKTFVTILAAAVLGGLGVYLMFEWFGAFALLQNNVVVNVTVFVLLLAAATIASAALCALFHLAIARADRNMVARLENRIRALEQGVSNKSTAPVSDRD
jgi:hypothetical protein